MADPNDLLPTWNPRGDSLEELESRVQRQTNSDRSQRDLDVLEQQYDRVSTLTLFLIFKFMKRMINS